MSSARHLVSSARALSFIAAVGCTAVAAACGGASSDSSSPGAAGGGGGGAGSVADASPPGRQVDSGGPIEADSGAAADSGVAHPVDSGHDDGGAAPPRDAAAPDAGGLDPSVAPGGNFDLSVWQLQEPVGSPGAPTTFSPAELIGPHGHQDTFFFTDPTDGSMSFWDPESGVTTANSNYPRSELREMTASGAAADWSPPGTHTLSATVKATQIPDHVAVGQIHLGTGTPASTKPLLELFYYKTGAIVMAIEQTPAGGNEVPYPAGNVPLGTPWSYVIGLSGNDITLTINGGPVQTFAMSSTFDQENMYFKAGDYDQTVGTTPTIGAKVQFYALEVFHGP